jgi:hypothetical protein
LDRRLGGIQSRSGRCGEERISFHCTYLKSKPSRPACSLDTAVTELPWFWVDTTKN